MSAGSYLGRGLDAVVVVVGFQDDILVQAVQQPQEELQGIMLGVPSELGAVLGHGGLGKRREAEGQSLLMHRHAQ